MTEERIRALDAAQELLRGIFPRSVEDLIAAADRIETYLRHGVERQKASLPTGSAQQSPYFGALNDPTFQAAGSGGLQS